MVRIVVAASAIVFLWTSFAFAQPSFQPCADSLDPLLGTLTSWALSADSSLDYGSVAFLTGAALSTGYTQAAGFHIPLRHQLLWPGNLFLLFDSTYSPPVPSSWKEAESLLVANAAAERRQLVLTRVGPRMIRHADTSLGTPWLIMTLCDSSRADSTIWDLADFRAHWWWWSDHPGTNTIWTFPKPRKLKVGRNTVRAGMRNAVLIARPDSTGGERFGIAALNAASARADMRPGSAAELARITRLRQAAADFLTEHVDNWPQKQREPVKLAAYYLLKAAESWRTITAVSEAWADYDMAQRSDWLAALVDWETKAAVALDQLVGESK